MVYREVYTQRGAVPEQPIGEMKNGLRCERLSSSGFCANAFRLLVHTLAYAIVVLFREATGGGAGGGDGDGDDVAAAAVEGGSGGGDEPATDLAARVGDVAVSWRVAAGAGGRRGLREATAG